MPKTVLIVDDSATMRKLIMRGIRQAGIAKAEFREAADGAEALKALETARCDLVVTDVNMPGMGGIEFVKAAGKLVAAPPIVMITTEGNEDLLKEALDHGARGVIKKPFTPDTIRQILGPLLR